MKKKSQNTLGIVIIYTLKFNYSRVTKFKQIPTFQEKYQESDNKEIKKGMVILVMLIKGRRDSTS